MGQELVLVLLTPLPPPPPASASDVSHLLEDFVLNVDDSSGGRSFCVSLVLSSKVSGGALEGGVERKRIVAMAPRYRPPGS